MALSLFPPNTFEIIARQQSKLHRAIRAIDEGRWPKLYSDKPVKRAGKPLSPFDELAGRLMAEARPRRGANGRLADAEYAAIAVELDKDFVLKDELEESFRKALAKWNQEHPRKAIKSFNAAVASSVRLPVGTPRRGVQRIFNRAEAKWNKRGVS